MMEKLLRCLEQKGYSFLELDADASFYCGRYGDENLNHIVMKWNDKGSFCLLMPEKDEELVSDIAEILGPAFTVRQKYGFNMWEWTDAQKSLFSVA